MLKAVISKGLLTYRWIVNGEGLFDDDRVIGDPLYDVDGKIEEFVWVDFDLNDVLSVNQPRKDLILAERAQAEADKLKLKLDKDTVALRLEELLVELDTSKIDDAFLVKCIKQIICILLDKPPEPDLLIKDVKP